jgi:hypothetical protein
MQVEWRGGLTPVEMKKNLVTEAPGLLSMLDCW